MTGGGGCDLIELFISLRVSHNGPSYACVALHPTLETEGNLYNKLENGLKQFISINSIGS